MIGTWLLGACGGGGTGGAPPPPAAGLSACPAAGMSTCGGAVEGPVWDLVSSCDEDAAAVLANPFELLDGCKPPYADVEGQLVHSGTLQLVGGEVHAVTRAHADITYRFADWCLESVNPIDSPADTCAAVLGSGALSCNYQWPVCTCTVALDGDISDTKAPYQISGSQMVWGGAEPSRAEFCVDGDRLTLDFVEHPVSRRWWILERSGG